MSESQNDDGAWVAKHGEGEITQGQGQGEHVPFNK